MKDVDLKKRVLGSRNTIIAYGSSFHEAAKERGLHNFAATGATLPTVSADEMSWMYSNRMVAGSSPGRAIYDELMLLPQDQICPICNQRTVASLDHFLPKKRFSTLALDPLNLVAVCQECNHIKASDFPLDEDKVFFHPYFESVDDVAWLNARVIESKPASVLYFVDFRHDRKLGQRIAEHFKRFKLGKLYASHSSRKLSSIRKYVTRMHATAGPSAVRRHLKDQAESHSEVTVNNWESALYRALAGSDWYVDGGFAP